MRILGRWNKHVQSARKGNVVEFYHRSIHATIHTHISCASVLSEPQSPFHSLREVHVVSKDRPLMTVSVGAGAIWEFPPVRVSRASGAPAAVPELFSRAFFVSAAVALPPLATPANRCRA